MATSSPAGHLTGEAFSTFQEQKVKTIIKVVYYNLTISRINYFYTDSKVNKLKITFKLLLFYNFVLFNAVLMSIIQEL